MSARQSHNILVLKSPLMLRRPPKKFSIDDEQGKFLLDGKPFQIISGEMHYPRIPLEYWRDRLVKAKEMGLNTVTTYVFWNLTNRKKVNSISAALPMSRGS